ncbi:Rv3235 family protein [Arthrobacter sp. Sr24]
MNTAAISETTAPTTLLAVKAVAFTGGVAAAPDNLVKLFPRGTRAGQAQRNTRDSAAPGKRTGGTADTAGTLGTVESAGTAGTVVSLDPEAAERAVVSNMSCKVAQSALEIINGARSVQQLARWLDVRCLSSLTTRARLYAQACREQDRHRSREGHPDNVRLLHRQPRVHSVHCFAVEPGIFETAVVVADRTRFRAIAMRLELSKGMWKVTALRIG